MKIVVALGGNALLERGEAPDADIQEHHVRVAAEALAPLVKEHEVVITHGNGPQVGVLALESGADPALVPPLPIRLLGRRDPRPDRELARWRRSNTPPRATKQSAC